MALLNDIPVHDGKLFTWHRNQFSGTTEASTLGGQMSRRVWDDAVDVGFYVTSPRTGRKVLFTLISVNHDAGGLGGEITSWTYKSHGFNTTMTITIFNT
jgi:hypothetical protein